MSSQLVNDALAVDGIPLKVSFPVTLSDFSFMY